MRSLSQETTSLIGIYGQIITEVDEIQQVKKDIAGLRDVFRLLKEKCDSTEAELKRYLEMMYAHNAKQAKRIDELEKLVYEENDTERLSNS